MRHTWALVVCAGALIAACGPASTSSTIAITHSATVSASASGATVRVSDGGNHTVAVAVTVTGPATLRGGCQSEIIASLAATNGSAVPTPVGGVHCLAIAVVEVPAGTSRTFTADLTAPGPGTYVVHSALNETSPSEKPALPDLTISVA